MSSLDGLYRHLTWHMRPSDPLARERFIVLQEVFRGLVQSRLSGLVESRNVVSVLDVAAGTGIAGAALASVLAGMGKPVRLVVTDARGGDLEFAREWLKLAGSKNKVDVETLVADATRLVEKVEGCFDIALLWGSSIPHFSPWSLALIIAGIRDLQHESSALLIDQRDLLPQILFTNTYEHLHLTSPVNEETGEGLLAVHNGYDQLRGVVQKAYYKLPGLAFVGTSPTRLWDVPSIAAITWLFYQEIHIESYKWRRELKAIIAQKPRKNALSNKELWSTLPERLEGKP